jgi:electron transfer flavoprotein beta subunit
VRIIVCIKQVPVEAGLRLEEGRWTLLRQGVASRVNHHDLQALETALILRNAHGGEVVVLTMGPPQAEEALREALAMGADRAVLLTDPAFSGADTLATTAVLGRAVRKLGPPLDLILCGARSSDSDTGQVGPQVAEDLGIPHLAYVTEVRIEGGRCVVRRHLDGQVETLGVAMPALLTVLRAPGRPRLIPLGGIERAFEGDGLMRWGLSQLGLDRTQVGLSGSATRVRSIREPQAWRHVRRLEGTPQEAVEAILKALKDHHILAQGPARNMARGRVEDDTDTGACA